MSKKIRLLSFVLVIVMLFSSTPIAPACAQEEEALSVEMTNPFRNDVSFTIDGQSVTSNSYRIPAMVTLADGTIVAAADIRWNTTYDGGGLDTLVARSTDGGKTWSYTVANYLGDNGNEYDPQSTTFIDPNLLVAADGQTVYMLVDLYAYGVALNGLWQTNTTPYFSYPTADTGFDTNGNLKLSSNKRGSFGYYLKDGKIYANGANEPEAGYTVDAYFNVTYVDNGVTKTANLFCADSPFQVAKTQFLYLTKSTDGGASWSAPTLLNLRKPAGTTAKNTDEDALLVSPGNAITTSGGIMVYPVYSYAHYGVSDSYQHMGLIYSTDGVNWERTENFEELNISSEGSVIELENGNLRVFFRNETGYLCYVDYDLHAKAWKPYVKTEIPTNSNTQLSAITYSKTSDGKQIVLISCPTGPNGKGSTSSDGSYRTNGKIHVFTVDAAGKMNLEKSIDVFDKAATAQLSGSNYTEEMGFFAYSCLTELSDGSIALLYENNQFGWGAGAGKYYTITNKGFAPSALGIKLDKPETVIVDANGNTVGSVTMGQYEKPELTASAPFSTANVDYQWQIEYEDGKWVDVYGEDSKTVKLSYGMVATLLDDDGKVDIRCKTTAGTQVVYSEPITVTIKMYQPETPDVVVSESFVSSNGETVTVTVAGSLPEDASVQLGATDSTGVDVKPSETVVAALDISINNADSTEWQPQSGETVTVTLEASKIGLKNGDEFVVYHLHNDEVKVLGSYKVVNDTVSFEVDGFSKFVFALAEQTLFADDLQSDIGRTATINDIYDYFSAVADPTAEEQKIAIEGKDYPAGIEVTITDVYVSSTYPYNIYYKVEVKNAEQLCDFLIEYPWIYQGHQDEDSSLATLILQETPQEPAEPSCGITVDGAAVSEVEVSVEDKVTVTATPTNVEAAVVTYQWQILIPTANMWVNISGQTTADCTINYGMVAGRLDADGKVKIRCVATADGVEIPSEPIAVNVLSGVSEASLEPAAVEPVAVFSTRAARSGAAPIAERDGSDSTTIYNVVINYVFENGETAETSYASKVGISGHLDSTVTFPTIQGYLPYVNDAHMDSYTFDLHGNQMTEDFVMTVVYKPTLVKYTVVVMHQNPYNDNYTEYERKTLQALTGTVISSDTEVDAHYDGFYQLLHNKVTVAADGSTVIEVRYDRYYYLMTFDLGDGGYGVLPVYARYGTEIEVETPTRPGYEFQYWKDASSTVTFPTEMPAHDIQITAVWAPKDAKYTIVYWKENADPNADGTYGYSYWGSRIVETVSGSVVSGSDDIPTSITNATVDGNTVNEKQYFTYNDTLTDKNVIVKGDGSTVVNVYYTRNYYTIYFKGYGTCCLEQHTHGTDCNSELICPIEEHTHTDCTRTLKCNIPEHTAHTRDCLGCGKTEHTAHTNACLQCTHTHTLGCYTYNANNLEVANDNNLNNNEEAAFDRLIELLGTTEPVSGTVYRSRRSNNNNTNYNFFYFEGTWYYLGTGNSYSGISVSNIGTPSYDAYTSAVANVSQWWCSHSQHTADCYMDEIHAHTASCYSDVIHTHQEPCYSYSCGKVNHTHTDDCYSDCTIPVHTHVNACHSNNASNTIYVITTKYEATIGDIWPTYDKLKEGQYAYEDNNGNVENASGDLFRGWSIDGISATATSKRINMTADLCDTSDGEKNATGVYDYDYYVHLYYMFESFDQTSPANGNNRRYYGGKYYDSSELYYQNVYGGTNSFSQKEIMGMEPVGTQSSQVSGDEYNNFLYYDRNRSTLTYQSIDTVVDTKSNIMYGESLKDYQYTVNNGVPPYPSTLEAGAYEFDGWYTTAGCYDGTEVNFDFATMPNGDMILYAKWEPVTHTVEFYTQKDDGGNLIDKIGDTYEVKHGQKLNEQYIPEAPEDFENGSYSFAGWWYMDGNTEKRFDFKSLPVTEDLVVYAKWTSNKQIEYRIHFQLANGMPVADSIISSDLAGTTITVDAKGGTDLYPLYQTGYFPDTKSHSLTLDIDDADGVMEFTFVYSSADAVPYSVYYVTETLKEGGTSLGEFGKDGKTYYIIAKTKVVNDNHLAYVSENFEPVAGYVPDGFQKNLVIVPGEDNTIIFYYSVDTVNAPYKVTHYTQNLDGKTWTVEYSYSGIAKIGDTYSEDPMTNLVGFTYDSSQSVASGEITADGLELELYYTRNKYPYKVVYKEQTSGDVLYTSDIVREYYGKVVAHTAPNIYGNYTRVSDATLTINIRIEEGTDEPELNVITFFYKETEVTLNYVVVGPDGCGTVTPGSESVKISSGVARGSVAHPSSSVYKFVGWYSDKACTKLLSNNATYVPTKADNTLWVDDTTYYAKFEYNLTSLTIVKEGAETYREIDPNQTFIFNIKGNGVDLDVTVHRDGNGNWSTTIDGLTVGIQYTITEMTGWSWRYEFSKVTYTGTGNSEFKAVDNGALVTLGASDNQLTFINSREENKWLDGDAWCDNRFDQATK